MATGEAERGPREPFDLKRIFEVEADKANDITTESLGGKVQAVVLGIISEGDIKMGEVSSLLSEALTIGQMDQTLSPEILRIRNLNMVVRLRREKQRLAILERRDGLTVKLETRLSAINHELFGRWDIARQGGYVEDFNILVNRRANGSKQS